MCVRFRMKHDAWRSGSSAVSTGGTDGSLTYTHSEHFSQWQTDRLGIFEYDIVECEHSSDVDARGLKPDWFVCCFSRQQRRIHCRSGFSCHRRKIELQNFQNEIRIVRARVREFMLFCYLCLVYLKHWFPQTCLIAFHFRGKCLWR